VQLPSLPEEMWIKILGFFRRHTRVPPQDYVE
jgi:hypothetical protein